MYEALAPAYDHFNRPEDYDCIAAFVFAILKEQGVADGLLLDLACGTGELTIRAADAGYDVVAVDVSPDMLAVARAKAEGRELTFVCQDMRELDLYGTFRACICTLDAVNHITDPGELLEVLRRVALFCEPGGVFIFDMNTEYKLNRLCDGAFIDEDDDYFVAWEVEQTGDRLFEFCVDVFKHTGDLYSRETDIFTERTYSADEVSHILSEVGFDVVGVYGDCTMSPPRIDEDRIYIAARRRAWEQPSE